jgi:predicted metalloprotease with PDZ domain
MTAPVQITYVVSSLETNTHRVHFRMEVRGVHDPSFDLLLPVWAPGAYEILESSREVRELTARRLGGTSELPVERREKNRWKVTTLGADAVEVRYTVYAHDAGDDAIDLSEEHLFLNAPRCLPWVAGREKEPVELVLNLPPAWKAYAELPRTGENPPRFQARDYEELVDTPVDCGTPVELTVRPAGIPHRILFCGGPGNYEEHRVEADVTKIVEAQVKFFGGSPLPAYTFFVHLADRRDGGLEHKFSTSLVVERNSFRPPEEYDRFLTLVSHEYFHLYNVKRIRPRVLGPFDFTRENYTHLLWWMEGTTDYAALLLVRRCGLFSPAKFLTKVAELAQRYLLTPGRAVRSLEEASFTAWVDLYRAYEETRNQSVSYYLKGLLVSMCLDLEIRSRTENRVGLDQVFRTLWKEYGEPGRGLEEGELFTVIQRVSGLDLTEFFDRYVRGTAELDLDAFARYAGLSFGPAPKPGGPNEPTEPAYLGIETTNDGGRVRVREVLDGTPARRAGVTPGDEVIALDGTRVMFDGFLDALKRFSPGEEVNVDLFRRGVLKRVKVVVGKTPPAKFAFTPVTNPTDLQRKVYAAWLDATWEAPSPNPPT